jgi:hypothetical protein
MYQNIAAVNFTGTQTSSPSDLVDTVGIRTRARLSVKFTSYGVIGRVPDVGKSERGEGVQPPPAPAWADFSIMMECGRCHSVYSVE